MTITPEEAKKLTREEKSKVRRLESEIDKALRNGARCIDVSFPNEKVKEEIIKLYREKGWPVKYEHEREGNYLDFRGKNDGR